MSDKTQQSLFPDFRPPVDPKKIPKPGCAAGDCLEVLQRFPDGYFDLVFADPPFNIGYQYDVYDDKQTAEDYLDWSEKWMKEVYRVLASNGTFWLAIGDEFAAELKVIANRNVGFSVRSWVIWYYTFGVNCKNKFTRSHTHLLYFVKDPAEFCFQADDPEVRIPSARQLVYNDKRANPKGRLPDDTWILRPQDLDKGFLPTEDTWYFPRIAGTFKQRQGWHGCQMPEQILARIIRSCSSPEDKVLDPFAGSGTTLRVAKKLDRVGYGVEISEKYSKEVNVALKSIKRGDELLGAEEPLSSAPKTGEKQVKKVVKKKKAAGKKVEKESSTKGASKKKVVTNNTSKKSTEKKSTEKKAAKKGSKKTVGKKTAAKKGVVKKAKNVSVKKSSKKRVKKSVTKKATKRKSDRAK